MYLDELQVGDFRIYGGAIEVRDAPGFVAAVSVIGTNGPRAQQIVFQDALLAGGHRFATGKEALRFAMKEGRQAVTQTG